MTITKKEAEKLYKQKLISKDKFDEMYNNYLDETYPVNIAGIKFNASDVLKKMDPTAYKVYKDDYANYLIQNGYIIEEYFDFDAFLQYLKESKNYTVIEDNELDEFEDNEFTKEEQQETKEKTKQHLKHTGPKLK